GPLGEGTGVGRGRSLAQANRLEALLERLELGPHPLDLEVKREHPGIGGNIGHHGLRRLHGERRRISHCILTPIGASWRGWAVGGAGSTAWASLRSRAATSRSASARARARARTSAAAASATRRRA